MDAPGPVSLIGSGETAAIGGQMLEYLVKPYPQPVKISVLETPAGFEENAERVAGRVVEYLATRLQNYQIQINQVPARKKGTPLSPDAPGIVEPLYQSQVIFFGPGSPTYTVRQMENSLAWQIIQARQRLGASLALASAATIATGTLALPVYEIYKVGEDPHWKPGLDLFRPYGLSLVVVPHWNNREGGAELDTSRCFIGLKRFQALCEQLPESVTILGIDEHTAVTIDFAGELCQVMGQGEVHLLRRDGSRILQEDCRAGCSFPLQALGDYHPLADRAAGLPETVWKTALEISQSKPDQPVIPPEVQQLVAAREEARREKNWALADQLREQISQAGWSVTDTPGGAEVTRK
jgi:cyanophycinase-like exopeptidase